MYKERNLASVILAAGKGTRMGGDLPKVLFKIKGRPMINHVIDSARKAAGDYIVVVVGYKADKVRSALESESGLLYAFQEEQLGTGHAVKCALPYLKENITDVIILFGDVPLIKESTISNMVNQHIVSGSDITILTAVLDEPQGYGRIVTCSNGCFLKIVEEKDADNELRAINEVNTGICCVSKKFLEGAVQKIYRNNAQNEFYFTDIIEIGNSDKRRIGRYIAEDSLEVTGVNTLGQLDYLESLVC